MRRALLLWVALLPGAASADTLTFFHTPSGNIQCLGVVGATGSFVDCDIFETATGRPALPRPPACDLDWGHRYTVGEAGPGGMGCVGDTVADPNGAVLPYGATLGFGAITCSSGEHGLECVNADGRGFFLSRASQRVF